jgi:Holliday junction resolvase RusA-like endonuclease
VTEQQQLVAELDNRGGARWVPAQQQQTVMPWPGSLDPILDVTVPGHPTPQGSKISNRHGGMRDPKRTVGARNFMIEFLDAHLQQQLVDVPVAVRVWFRFARPGSHYLPANTRRRVRELRPDAPTWHAIEPDTDKCCRLVGDALEISRVLTNDKLIASWHAEKRWDETSSTRIQIIIL